MAWWFGAPLHEFLFIAHTHILSLSLSSDRSGSELLIRGLQESDARLAALEAQAQAEPYSVIVLMPCEVRSHPSCLL